MRLTKTQKAISKANNEYTAAFRQWQGTEKDSHGTTECAADMRCALPHLRRAAWAAWDRLVKVSGEGTPAERVTFAWALLADDYAPNLMHE